MVLLNRRRDYARLLLAGAAAGSLITFSAPALAADAASGTSTADTAPELQDIVVTATKRETNVQTTPIAVTALSDKLLQQNNVVDAVGLNGLVPSLVISTSEGFERNVAIRGVGFNVPQNDSAQPSVSYHVDGVYIANPVALNTNFLDVSHVEVVRGPQGTVYGQNSTGGTINVITNQPVLGKFTGSAKVDGGNFDLIQGEAALNIPLGDTLAVRFAAQGVSHSGFATATKVPGTNGDYDLSDEHSVHLRGTLLWEPSDSMSLLLRAEYAHAKNHNTEGKSIFDTDPDAWRESSDWPGIIEYTNTLESATLNYDFGFAKLKAMGSYQMVRQNGSVNEDGLDLDGAIAAYGVPGFTAVHDIEYLYHRSTAWTGEVDLASPTGQPLEWIVGGFFLRSNYQVAYDQYAVNSYPVAGQPTSLVNQLFPRITDPDNLGFLGADDNFYFPYFYSYSYLTRRSFSLYGQATYHVTDAFRVTGGLRYTNDRNTTDICDYACSASTFVKQSSTAWTGKIGVEADIAPKTMGYASFSTGYKPGGGNISPAPIILGFDYKPEKVKSYEVGVKSTFLDNRVRLNLAGFYYDYHDLQYEAEDAVAYQGGVDNIPRMHIYGMEAETSILLPANLRFDGNLTLEDSKITSHYMVLDNVRGYAIDKQIFASGNSVFYDPGRAADIVAREAAFFDVYGNQAPNLPHVTAMAMLTHTLDLGNSGTLTTSVQGQFRSHYINAAYGDVVVNGVHVYRSPGYSLFNANITYQPLNPHFKIAVSVKNIANKAAVLGQFTNQFGGEITRQYAPPRQVIGSISYNF